MEDSPRTSFGKKYGKELALLLNNHVNTYQFGYNINLYVLIITLLEAKAIVFNNITVFIDCVYKDYFY